MFYSIAWTVCSLGLRLFFSFRSFGRRNVPKVGGCILAVNHQSNLDPVLVGCGLTRPAHFMGKTSLFEGFLGVLLRRLNSFPVDRGGADRKAVKEFVRRLRVGFPVMLFPEGTRTSDGRLGPIMPGVASIAIRAEVPIVPAYIDGAFDAWPRHKKLPRRAPLSITYGRPIPLEKKEGESKRDLQNRLVAELKAALAELEAKAFAKKRRSRTMAG